MVLSRGDVDDIRKIVADQITTTILGEQFQNRLIESLIKKLDDKFSKRIEKLEGDVELVRKEMDTLRCENNTLKRKMDAQEQYSRNNNIRIFGLPYKKNEDVLKVVTDLFVNKIKIDINNSDIVNIHRVAAKNPSVDKPPAILIQFRDANKRTTVLKQRKMLKGSRIVIREDLTQFRLSLFKTAVGKFSEKNVWSLHGNIYIKSESGVHRIDSDSEMDLAGIK